MNDDIFDDLERLRQELLAFNCPDKAMTVRAAVERIRELQRLLDELARLGSREAK